MRLVCMNLATNATLKSDFVAERISSLSPSRSGRPLYPWAEWMDGSAWRIRRGEDFVPPALSMATTLRSQAHRRGVSVTVRLDGDTVEFQFGPRAEVAA
jgi:hypothetical protein